MRRILIGLLRSHMFFMRKVSEYARNGWRRGKEERRARGKITPFARDRAITRGKDGLYEHLRQREEGGGGL